MNTEQVAVLWWKCGRPGHRAWHLEIVRVTEPGRMDWVHIAAVNSTNRKKVLVMSQSFGPHLARMIGCPFVKLDIRRPDYEERLEAVLAALMPRG